jgi:nicotinamidase-related amidase
MKKLLIGVDMQNDFVYGVLGTAEARAILPNVESIISRYRKEGAEIVFTRDTHDEAYSRTQEGRRLPVPHCIKDTEGWQICDELIGYADVVVDKITFGSVELPQILKDYGEEIEEIELCGLCTDICVISNAFVLKSSFPETKIVVDAKCCAGVSVESHETALSAMRAVQIEIVD